MIFLLVISLGKETLTQIGAEGGEFFVCGVGKSRGKSFAPVADVTTFDDRTPVAADDGTDQVGLARLAALSEVSEIQNT